MLESASELGEIGAGIQMTPNVARLLQRWGIAEVIGSNLVNFDRLYLRTEYGRIVGRMDSPGNGGPERGAGAPWWVVHRMHLHDGLVQVARKRGVEVVTGARVVEINYQVDEGEKVRVKDHKGRDWAFDLVIGADGLNSITRRTILPHVKPTPPTNLAAYRATVPMEKVRSDPITRELVENPYMDIWMGAKGGEGHGYVIAYPISGGKVYNMVLSHFRSYPVMNVEDATLEEVKETYKNHDPRLRRVLDMVTHNIRRWPLLVTRCPTWSSPQKNLVLMGDAAHSMVNHLAQGAATAMEDGAFLGIFLREVAKGTMTLSEAISKYEEERMPLADLKQQKSFVTGTVYHLEEGSPEQIARDEHLKAELTGEQLIRTPNLNADPHLWRTVFAYDAEEHAERAVQQVLQKNELRNPTTHVTKEIAETYMNYWLPSGNLKIRSLL
ncbi:3-hydroxybenzoate 6-hydroxylase [Cytospora mali]|uniref:3-hydroxybenzoate 6-hydroxylase n=1 Tax=Cytospora mali TaxID=578113 RepID=A0A194VRK0_CYTMA|nr:3-hydroxybenzoate 6-hydroxylase [Valsa mali]QZJ85036.1 Hbh2 [Valsa mali]